MKRAISIYVFVVVELRHGICRRLLFGLLRVSCAVADVEIREKEKEGEGGPGRPFIHD